MNLRTPILLLSLLTASAARSADPVPAIGEPPTLNWSETGRAVTVKAQMHSPGLWSVLLRMPKTTGGPRNYTDTVSVDRTFLILPSDTLRALGRISYETASVLGNAWGTIDISVTYRVPAPAGKKDMPYRLVLDAGRVNHLFGLAQGDTVFAARKGTVITVDTPKRANAAVQARGQRIVVQHVDGSWAAYTGLTEGSATVKVGQTVWPDSPLGTAGNNGKYGYSVLVSIRAPHMAEDRRGRGFFDLSDIQPAWATESLTALPGRGKGWTITPRVSYENIVQEMTPADVEAMREAAEQMSKAAEAVPTE